jgi:PPP family 3-phenylpropionic acid transporter
LSIWQEISLSMDLSIKPGSSSASRSIVSWQSLMYLVTYAGRGFYSPFISLYLLSVGFSATEVGLLAGVSAVVRLVVTPLVSSLADRYGAHRRLLTGMISATAGATLTAILFTPKLIISGAFIARDSSDVPGAALMAQLSIAGMDSKDQSSYAKLRAMGSIGWGLATVISGPLIALGGYVLILLISTVLNLLILPVVRIFPPRTSETTSRISKPPRRSRAFWLIMFANFLFYVGMNTMSVFMFVYFKDYLGADDGMIGVYAALLGISEVPWMLVMGRIYRRISSLTALNIGIAGQALFLAALALLTDAPGLLVLIFARGIFYSLQNISLTLLVSEVSHPSNVATNQAITWVTVPGVAAVLTGPLAGLMYDNGDARLLFALAGGVAIMGSLVLFFSRGAISRVQRERASIAQISAVSPLSETLPLAP